MRLVTIALGLLLTAGTACAQRSPAPCRFYGADYQFELREERVSHLAIARRDAEPDALLLIVGTPAPGAREATIRAYRIDFSTGEQANDSIPYRLKADGTSGSPGHTLFTTGLPAVAPDAPELIRNGTLHVEFDGKKITYPIYSGDFGNPTPKWRSKQLFNGMRKVKYGNTTLFEQELENSEWVPGVASDVAIEPDGDRIVCMCVDTATRLALYRRSKLEQKKE